MPVLAAAKDAGPTTLWWFFGLFFVLALALQYAQVMSERAKTTPQRKDFPYYPLFAVAVAYVAWAIAIPDSVFIRQLHLPNWSGLVAVGSSLAVIKRHPN